MKTKLNRFILTTALSLGLSIGHAEEFKLSGWREVIASVSDLPVHIAFFESVAGWEIKCQGKVSRAQLDFWGLPEQAQADQVLMGNIGADSGFVRLVRFTGVAQEQIRSNARTWDTGGIFNVGVRILDMDKKFQQMQAAAWSAHSDPMQFNFGPFVVKEWLTVGPDGISLALIERIKPMLQGWPNLREFSRAFNSTQIVQDMEAARHFYMDILGFKKYLYSKGTSKGTGENVLGLPYNLATEEEREVWIIHPDGMNEGSVELLAFTDVSGRDFAARAVPPNLGLMALRFPVKNLARFEEHLRNKEVALEKLMTPVALPYYGSKKLLAIRTPDGAWLEFFE